MIKIAVAVAATSLVVSPASARVGDWQVGHNQIHIVHRDLDTTTIAGRAALLARVERAVTRLCDYEAVRLVKRACFRATMAETIAQPRASALRMAMSEAKGVAFASK